MDYLKIVMIVFGVIWGIFALLLFHYLVFTVVGIFAKKRYPVTEKKLKYAVLIGARNEEAVIGELLDSIADSDYPKDKLQVFVVAHNCTDNTAAIARAKGATVYEYDNLQERTVGFAYRYLTERIREDRGIGSFDGFFIINADNVVSENYFSKMNDAFVATGGKHVVTSYRNSKNFGSNAMACLYGIFFLAACRFESRGRTVCGCSTRVSGTGYLFGSELLKDGWEYVTLTEDWEFTADRIARGSKVVYCDDAEFFDEQPMTLKVMLRQRLRWARGHMIVFFTRFRRLIKSFFTPKNKGGKNKFSVFDISMSILPLGVISVVLGIAQTVCIALCPLFGYDAAWIWAVYGVYTAVGWGLSYLLTVISAVVLILLERNRIPRVRTGTKIAAVLLWPFFLALNIVLDVISLFVRKLEWKVIPHGETMKTRTTEQNL